MHFTYFDSISSLYQIHGAFQGFSVKSSSPSPPTCVSVFIRSDSGWGNKKHEKTWQFWGDVFCVQCQSRGFSETSSKVCKKHDGDASFFFTTLYVSPRSLLGRSVGNGCVVLPYRKYIQTASYIPHYVGRVYVSLFCESLFSVCAGIL